MQNSLAEHFGFVAGSSSEVLICYNCPDLIGDSRCIMDEETYGEPILCNEPWNACYKKTTGLT